MLLLIGNGSRERSVGDMEKRSIKGERLKGASLTFEPFDAILTKNVG